MFDAGYIRKRALIDALEHPGRRVRGDADIEAVAEDEDALGVANVVGPTVEHVEPQGDEWALPQQGGQFLGEDRAAFRGGASRRKHSRPETALVARRRAGVSGLVGGGRGGFEFVLGSRTQVRFEFFSFVADGVEVHPLWADERPTLFDHLADGRSNAPAE